MAVTEVGAKGVRQMVILATIAALTKLMDSAGVSTAGKRPAVVDIYARPAAPPENRQRR